MIHTEEQFHKTLAERVHRKLFKENKTTDSHDHFFISHHKDHLILLCSEPNTGRIIAKSRRCRQGECRPWHESSFRGFNREQILRDMAPEISRIRIDCGGCNMSWRELDDFLAWLQE